MCHQAGFRSSGRAGHSRAAVTRKCQIQTALLLVAALAERHAGMNRCLRLGAAQRAVGRVGTNMPRTSLHWACSKGCMQGRPTRPSPPRSLLPSLPLWPQLEFVRASSLFGRYFSAPYSKGTLGGHPRRPPYPSSRSPPLYLPPSPSHHPPVFLISCPYRLELRHQWTPDFPGWRAGTRGRPQPVGGQPVERPLGGAAVSKSQRHSHQVAAPPTSP
mmetsp:Transcript_814/g.2606  ORF Transcript_814/g.2606 Transcript_814/m.2606 type:complete len:216 (-) Transcript_814:640-1287(-)